VTDKHHRALRASDQVECLRDLFRRGAASLRVERRRWRRHFDVVFFLEHVERHVDVHRTGTTGQHGRRRLPQSERQHVDARRLKAALHHRAHDIHEIGLKVPVDLLKRTAIELRRRHIRGDGQKCRGIRQRAGERHDDVARARPAGRKRRDRLVANPEVGIRHVGGDLLVAWRHQRDAVARLVEWIEHADIAVAANAEDIGNVAGDQIFGDQLGAFHPRHVCSPKLMSNPRSVTNSRLRDRAPPKRFTQRPK
jgi:hypothetical protein